MLIARGARVARHDGLAARLDHQVRLRVEARSLDKLPPFTSMRFGCAAVLGYYSSVCELMAKNLSLKLMKPTESGSQFNLVFG